MMASSTDANIVNNNDEEEDDVTEIENEDTIVVDNTSLCDLCGKRLKNAKGVKQHKRKIHRDVQTSETSLIDGEGL